MRARVRRVVGAVVVAAVAMGWAIGTPDAQAAPPTLATPNGKAPSALNSELVSVRQVEPGVQRYKFRYGPLVAPAGENLVLAGPVTIEKPAGNGYLRRYRPDLVGVDGVPPRVDVVHMHHALLMNLSEQDRVTPTHEGAVPTPLRIAGWAEEKTIAELPDPYGYPVKATDVWAVNYMLHNATPQTHVVWIELELDWIPAGTPAADRMKPAYPLWFDVRNGEVYPVFDVRQGTGRNGITRYPDDFPDAYDNWNGSGNGDATGPKLNDWMVDRDMTLVATAGHVHPGGLFTELEVVRGDESALAFRSTAHYFDPNGPVSWDMAMEVAPPDWRVKVRKGDLLRISGTYETDRASWYENMSIMLAYYTLEEDAGGLDPFKDVIQTSGDITHGPLPEASNHGGEPSGLPDPRTLPDGANLPFVGIGGFVYGPGDTSASGQLGQPPVVDRGNPLTFFNLDASAQVPHTITACRAPCNRTTGVSYPLANAEVQFDSGQLGYGTPLFSAFAQRADFQTPEDLEPGTYTYFCRVHPFMRGAFRVRDSED